MTTNELIRELSTRIERATTRRDFLIVDGEQVSADSAAHLSTRLRQLETAATACWLDRGGCVNKDGQRRPCTDRAGHPGECRNGNDG